MAPSSSQQLLSSTIHGLRQFLQPQGGGHITSRHLAELCLQRAKKWQPACNSFVTLADEQRVLAQAEEADKRRAQQATAAAAAAAAPSPLDGIPYALKDNFCTRELRTTCGSNMLRDYVPPYNSSMFERLSEASGAVMLGKTNMDEFAMGSGTTFSAFGPTAVNPKQHYFDDDESSSTVGELHERYVAGGSSGGSAAAVLTGASFFAIGTDTGGSVRQPAAYCGLVGLKPTYGVVSRHGMIAFASSLDTAGIFARDVLDSALVLDAVVGVDARDSSSRQHPDLACGLPAAFAAEIESLSKDECRLVDLKGVKIGIPMEYGVDELDDEVLRVWTRAIELLRTAGADVRYVSLPNTKHALPAYYVIAPAEASSNLARYDGVRYGNRVAAAEGARTLVDLYTCSRTQGFGPEVKRRILSGTFVLSVDKYDTYFKRSQQVRQMVSDDFARVFGAQQQGFDLILTPTAPTPAIPLDKYRSLPPVDCYANDIFTIPASLAGLPAISVPYKGKSPSSMPFGLQLIADAFQEKKLLRGAAALERLLAEESAIGKDQ